MKARRRILARCKDLASESGASFVEVALVLGILGPLMLLGTAGAAVLIYSSIEVSDATHAGAAFAAEYYKNNSSTLPTASQVTTAAQNDAPEITTMLKSGTSLSVSMATGCNGGAATAGNTVPSCGAGVLPYVQVTTQAQVMPLTTFVGLPNSITMGTTATINLVN